MTYKTKVSSHVKSRKTGNTSVTKKYSYDEQQWKNNDRAQWVEPRIIKKPLSREQDKTKKQWKTYKSIQIICEYIPQNKNKNKQNIYKPTVD